jgi:hypothetical protein
MCLYFLFNKQIQIPLGQIDELNFKRERTLSGTHKMRTNWNTQIQLQFQLQHKHKHMITYTGERRERNDELVV